MTPEQLARLLQVVDSSFPVGAFAYSDGLESAVASGALADVAGLDAWLRHARDVVFVSADGLGLVRCHRAFGLGDWATIETVDRELTALKPSAAGRAASKAVGRRHLTTCADAFGDEALAGVGARLPEGNAAVVYGVVFAHLGLSSREALTAFGYLRLAGVVSAALRLMSLGQQHGQRLLAAALGELPAAIERVYARESGALGSFSPRLDVQQMNHRYVYSRLFRS